jgi:hypothetical protein
MKEHSKYRVEGYLDMDAVGTRGYEVSRDVDTLKEAKQRAAQMLMDSEVFVGYVRTVLVLGGHERDDQFVFDKQHKQKKTRFKADKRDDDDPDSPTNGDRAKHAEKALDRFLISTGESRTIDEDAVRDLMADLLHFCDRQDIPGAKIMATARRDWRAER